MNEELTLLDYFKVIRNKWWLIVSIFVLAEVTSAVISMKKPKIYESTSSMLPPKTDVFEVKKS